MVQEIETERTRSRRYDFVICCILGVSTCVLLIARIVRMRHFITSRGWVHLGIAVLAMAAAAFHFLTLERSLSNDQIDETTQRRLRSSIEWLYIAFNAGVFGVMYFINSTHLAH